MLANLLNRKRAKKETPRTYQWWFLGALPLWVVLCYFAAQLLLIVVFAVAKLFGISIKEFFSPVIVQTVLTGLSYAITLAIVIGVPYIVRKRPTSLQVLGLQRLLIWTDIGLAPLAFLAYALIIGLVLVVLTNLIPGFPLNEAQNIGFKTFHAQYEYLFAFLTLVVMAPVAEEALFRGYLYGKLRLHVPVWAAMLMTAFLFAIAHGQWNVAIDTFILSLILTGLREITGSIWAGIVLHMLKNAIAFFSLFAPPMMLGF